MSGRAGRYVALIIFVAAAWTSALRADIFVSHGAGNSLSATVSSFSQYTGAAKLTITGGLVYSEGMAFGPDGNLYVADQSNGSVLRFNPSTGALIGTFVAPVSGSVPFAITFGPDGNLYLADNMGYIRRYNGSSGAPTGTFTCAPPSGGTCYPFGLTFGPDGNLYVSDLSSRGVLKLNGTTLAYMGVFVPAMGSPASTFPWGLHFGPNGNLYVAFSEPPGNVYDILEFNGSSGAFIAAFLATGLVNADFAFAPAPDTEIYVANNYGFQRYSSSTGSLLSTFGSGYNGTAGFIVMGGPVPTIPPYLIYDPLTVNNLQTLRLTVVNGPVRVPPGVPVEAQLGFLGKGGHAVGPTLVVNLNPGQTGTLDLDASTLISSGRIELQPTVTALPGTPLGSLQGSAEVFTTSNGVGSVFYAGIPVPPVSNITGPPSFVPQGVIYGESIQINVLAPPDSPCVALLSFTDANGNPTGPTLDVNLSPGTMSSLTYNPNSITQSGRQEFVPQMTPSNPVGGSGVASACLGSSEVINQRTSAVSTYQASSPAVGTANP
jgi:outer membrane protein assembly factor BamB